MKQWIYALTPCLAFHLVFSGLLIVSLNGCTYGTHRIKPTILINHHVLAYTYLPSTSHTTKPTVVFQSGLGDDQTVWQAVIKGLGDKVASLRYDRAGYGASAAASAPRTPCQIASEQHELLQTLGISPPYILVGHSLGGLYEYVYANLYPHEVAGLVLLDPTHPQHWQRIQAELPAIATLLSTSRLVFGSTACQEFDAQQTCLEQLTAKLPNSISTRLLVSTQRTALEQGAFEQMLKELALDWQRKTNAPIIQTINSGHYIQSEQPEAVIMAIHEILRFKAKSP
ncbi:alpha/beta fold hydrolase [Thiolinea disciformis]|uniref:alpha/beta fold hydrolase n=1 Tax=Thiolinea disciformis TaxID=125614 RepID=UPI00037DAB0E|nr:alpha/beta hydrolase [Thiolinea disciformis]